MRDAEHFYELLTKAHEGNASPQEAAWINRAIKTDREAARYYIEFFELATGLTDMEEASFGLRPPLSGDNVPMSLLAMEEKPAPAVADPLPRVEEMPAAKPARSKRNGILSLPAFIISAAAYIFILLYINLVPPLEHCAEAGKTVHPEWVHPERGLITGQANPAHRLNGEATPIPDQWDKAGAAQPITAGRVRSVDVRGRVKEIPMAPGLFVRRIADKTGSGETMNHAKTGRGGCHFCRPELAIEPNRYS